MPLVDLQNLGQIGIVTDVTDTEVPEGGWSTGNNVVFRDGIAQRIAGESSIFGTPLLDPDVLLFYPDPQSGNAYWIYAGDSIASPGTFEIAAFDGTGHSVIETPISDAYASRNGYTKGAVSGVPFIHDGSNPPWVWLRDGSGNLKSTGMEPLPNWIAGLQAMYVRPFREFYIAMDITESSGPRNPSRLMWSHPAAAYSAPDSFDITDTAYLAGDKTLGDTSDYLVDCLPLRGHNVVYKRNETWLMSLVNTADVFAFKRLFKDWGLLGPRLVCAVKGTHHFCVTNTKDIILHDGNTFKSIADGRVRSELDNIDENNLLRAFVAPHNQEEEIWFHYPTSGNTYCNRVAIWNWNNGQWSFRDATNATDMVFGVPDVDVTVAADNWGSGSFTLTGATTVANGETVTQNVTGATGIVQNASGSVTQLVLEDLTGDWDTTNQLVGSVTGAMGASSVPTDLGSTYAWDSETTKVWNEFTSSLLLAKDIQATNTGFLIVDDGNLIGGAAYNGYLERTGIDLDDPGLHKLFQELYPRVQGNPVDISIGASNSRNGPYTWQKKTFDPDSANKMSFRKNGKYLGIRIEGQNAWRLDGMKLNVIPRGRR